MNRKLIGDIIIFISNMIIIILLVFYALYIRDIGIKSEDSSLNSFCFTIAFSLLLLCGTHFFNSLNDLRNSLNNYDLNKKLDKNYKEINKKLDKIIHKDIKNKIKKCNDECAILNITECDGTKRKDGYCDRK